MFLIVFRINECKKVLCELFISLHERLRAELNKNNFSKRNIHHKLYWQLIVYLNCEWSKMKDFNWRDEGDRWWLFTVYSSRYFSLWSSWLLIILTGYLSPKKNYWMFVATKKNAFQNGRNWTGKMCIKIR